MTAGSTFFIISAGMSNVLKGKYNKRLNYLNETSLLIHCYLYFLFSDFVPDPVLRYKVGFLLVANTCFNFSVNVLLMLIQSAR